MDVKSAIPFPAVLACLVFAGMVVDLFFRLVHPSNSTAENVFLIFLMMLSGAGAAFSVRQFLTARKTVPPDSSDAARTGGAGRSGMEHSIPIIFHEIKNYASTLKGNTVLLRKTLPEGESEQTFLRLERATERIERLSKEVLDLSLLGKSAGSSNVDLLVLIRTCAENYFSGLELAFSFTTDRSTLPIQGDPVRLEQVFLNLFKNSLEAGASHVKISILAQSGKVGILLEDDGKGCSSTEIERMFDAYQSFRRSQGGSGLGLFLVKAIIEGHGGTISGITKNDKAQGAKGMIFVLHFPINGNPIGNEPSARVRH
jgi:signal transduction histidine kinase